MRKSSDSQSRTLTFLAPLLAAILGSTLMGCNRAEDNSSVVSFRTPTRAALAMSKSSEATKSAALPTDRKICFGVAVSGPGISTPAGSPCLSNIGAFTGFAPEDSELSIVVPRGSSRKFELYVYLADSGKECPSIKPENFDSSVLNRTYSSGITQGITIAKASEAVAINLNFPGIENSLAADSAVGACLKTGRLKGTLLSNGDVLDANGTPFSVSSPLNESWYHSSFSDIYGIGYITSGGVLNLGSSAPVEVPPFVYSVTRKPDSGVTYGLLHDGQIVEINTSTTVASITVPLSCPFSVTGCKVPLWMQSISAGFGDELHGVDHGGMIYRLDQNGATAVGTDVGPNVTQVSYY